MFIGAGISIPQWVWVAGLTVVLFLVAKYAKGLLRFVLWIAILILAITTVTLVLSDWLAMTFIFLILLVVVTFKVLARRRKKRKEEKKQGPTINIHNYPNNP